MDLWEPEAVRQAIRHLLNTEGMLASSHDDVTY